jgi:hypothetical protein
MSTVPIPTPVTTPVDEPIDAFEISLLLQVPPPASTNVTLVPIQTPVEPLIEEGKGFTVATIVALQPPLAE